MNFHRIVAQFEEIENLFEHLAEFENIFENSFSYDFESNILISENSYILICNINYKYDNKKN